MIATAQDGTGDFTSVQAAADAVPQYTQEPVVLLVRPGTGEFPGDLIANILMK